MDHHAQAHQCSHISRSHRWTCACGTRRRHFLITLAVVVVIFLTGCGTSTSRSSSSGFDASQMTAWLAKLFYINSPTWMNGVIAGKPCSSDQPGHPFCPNEIATTPDGRILALIAKSGELKVWDVTKRRLLFDEPGLAYKLQGQGQEQRRVLLNESGAAYRFLGDSAVWLSSDDRLVARAVHSDNGTDPPEVTIGFQIWDIATHRRLLTDTPAPSSPWDNLQTVGLAPNEYVLVFQNHPFWDWVKGQVKVDYRDYHSAEKPASISYLAGRAEWLLTLDGTVNGMCCSTSTRAGYATWAPRTRLSIVRPPPCDRWSQEVSTNGNGQLYACETGPAKFSTHSNSVLIWNVTKRVEFARLKDSRNMGSVLGFAFLNDGRSFAIMAYPRGTPGEGQVLPENLLLYSLSPHPAEDGVITLPGVSGGWGVYSIGSFAVAIGYSAVTHAAGYCCLKAVMWPVSQRPNP
jgi:hypothetical protein